MGEPIFDVELFHAAYSDRHPIVELTLPATPWEMADAMDALRLGEGERMVVEVLDSHDFDCVDLFIAAEDNIYALNVLAQRLSELNDGERAIFRGAVKIEAQKDGSIDLMKLIDLAFSTDSYNVAPDVRNDGQLGRFYAEGGFVPETDGLTDAQFELLDFAKIGRRMRESEDGTFCDVGYVVRTGEIVDVSRAIEFKPEAADYAVSGSFKLNNSSENFVGAQVRTIMIPRARTDGGNVPHSGGTGSSIHVGSSGTTHGGSHGKF